ncbi:MAG: alpha/beta hydrolase-fold protein [Planctomycetota bacterium]
MSKETATWHSERFGEEINLVRWGEMGTPLLVFPTAGGDAEEIERFYLVDALGDLLGANRIKVYSVDSLAGRAWLTDDNRAVAAAEAQHRFDACIHHEVLPAIRRDCNDEEIEVAVAGASIGAFNALAAICRHPEAYSTAICMSGTYDLRKFLRGPTNVDFHNCSPVDFVPTLEDGAHLEQLRQRFVLLTHGEGRWEEPAQSWKTAEVLGRRGVPNRVDAWGDEWDHDWVTWRKMLPQYVDELLP